MGNAAEYAKSAGRCVRRFFRSQGVDQIDAALMTAAVELLGEEGVHQTHGLLGADHAGADGEHVGVVVVAGELHGVFLGGVHTADALHAVGGQGDAEAGAADEYAALRFAVGHGLGHRMAVHGVVAALGGEGAEVDDLVPQLAGVSHQHLAVFIAGMVASKCNFHISYRPFRFIWRFFCHRWRPNCFANIISQAASHGNTQ